MFCWCWIRLFSLNSSRCFYLDKEACFCCMNSQQLGVHYESILLRKFRPPAFELYSNVMGGVSTWQYTEWVCPVGPWRCIYSLKRSSKVKLRGISCTNKRNGKQWAIYHACKLIKTYDKLESGSWTADCRRGSSVKDEFPVNTHFCFPRLGHETLWSLQFWQDTSLLRHQKALGLLTLKVLWTSVLDFALQI